MENIVAIQGILRSIEDVTEVNGMAFSGSRAAVITTRQSGREDEAIVLIKDELIAGKQLQTDKPVMLTGAMQTHKNYHTGKVQVYVLADFIEQITGKGWEQENEVRIKGTLALGLKYRQTPKGKNITNMFVKVPCIERDLDCFIPCICWGSRAIEAADYVEGEAVALVGRLQSREYIKRLDDGTTETRICYEVSANEVERI